jgi:hypothetical protein
MDLLKRHQAWAIEKERKKIERWHLTRTKGKWRYILLFTLWNGLGIGTIMASTISLMENGLSPLKFVVGWPLRFFLIFVVIGSLSGFFFGWHQWNFYESVYLKRQSDKQA